MKGCIVAAVVLAIVLSLVAVNAIYVRHVSTTLTEMTESLPDLPDGGTPEEVQKIRAYLERHTGLLSLSVNYTLLARLSETLAMLEAYAQAGNAMQYAATLAVLREICLDIARAERFHVKNLL